jgi:phage terminase small subunit
MTGPLKNARHERFAQERAKGKAVDAAYAGAGFKPHRGNAHRLSTKESVVARVAELQARTAEKVTTTAADIARQLDEDRAFAKEVGQAGAAVSASLGKAKVLGLVVDKRELTGANGGPIDIRALNALTDEELEQLERIRAKLALAGSDQG